ncbi:hypothetical protein PF672P2_00004 [Parabacteroides phage PF672P2]|nr:hypothetical protein PF672P1_00042 [Parabacteroides phage PF672P1]WAX17141.1 hypothetical protein PF672P2_00004 [Parabacteroides phage PF672P2]
MKLNLSDRVFILESGIVKVNGTISEAEISESISEKIFITRSEEKTMVKTQVSPDSFMVSYTSKSAFNEEDFNITDEELEYLKEGVNHLNNIGMVNKYNLDSVKKIIDQPFIDPVLTEKWHEIFYPTIQESDNV